MKISISIKTDKRKAEKLARKMPAERAEVLSASKMVLHFEKDGNTRTRGRTLPPDAVRAIKSTVRELDLPPGSALGLIYVVNLMRQGCYDSAEEYEQSIVEIERRGDVKIDRTKIPAFIPGGDPVEQERMRKRIEADKKARRAARAKKSATKSATKTKKPSPKVKKTTLTKKSTAKQLRKV